MTFVLLLTQIFFSYFNSHPHEEDDKFDGSVLYPHSYFNSHPHEEDDGDSMGTGTLTVIYFNSHPHEEDDELSELILQMLIHFNSHPHEEDDSNFKQK